MRHGEAAVGADPWVRSKTRHWCGTAGDTPRARNVRGIADNNYLSDCRLIVHQSHRVRRTKGGVHDEISHLILLSKSALLNGLIFS